jgi:Fe-S cluster assembly protein SufD
VNDLAINDYLGAHPDMSAALAGNTTAWVAQTRRDALERFQSEGFPTSRHEAWRYTNVRSILKQSFTPSVAQSGDAVEIDLEKLSITPAVGPRLVFVNGHFSSQLSTLVDIDAGVHARSLAAALNNDPDSVKPYLARQTSERAHGFTIFNTAFAGDGALIELDAGVKAAQPIELLYIVTTPTPGALAQPRNLLIAGANSEAQIVERYIGPDGDTYFTNAVTEIVLQQGAHLGHYKLQEEGDKAFHIGGLFVRHETGSRLYAHSISIGGSLVRNDVHVVLGAPHSECVLNGLYVAGGRQHVDNHTHIDHAEPDTNSSEVYKGIVDGRARAVFQGRVVVHKDAQRSDAHQSNKNLLLSRNAEVDTKPQLEIYADDVACSHGATIGQLDPDAVFYMRSRGVTEDAARGLLTYAFANDVVEKIQITTLRERLESVIATKLLQRESVEELL